MSIYSFLYPVPVPVYAAVKRAPHSPELQATTINHALTGTSGHDKQELGISVSEWPTVKLIISFLWPRS